MKSVTKLLSLVICLLMLTNCKVEFAKVNAEDPPTTGLDTEIKEIHYSDGGWHPAPGQPNFRAILSMKLTDNSKVDLDLETPECHMVKSIGTSDYLELAALIEDAELFFENDNINIIDAGSEYITTVSLAHIEPDDRPVSPSDANALTLMEPIERETEIHLRKGDSSQKKLRFKHPEVIREKVNEIIEAFGC